MIMRLFFFGHAKRESETSIFLLPLKETFVLSQRQLPKTIIQKGNLTLWQDVFLFVHKFLGLHYLKQTNIQEKSYRDLSDDRFGSCVTIYIIWHRTAQSKALVLQVPSQEAFRNQSCSRQGFVTSTVMQGILLCPSNDKAISSVFSTGNLVVPFAVWITVESLSRGAVVEENEPPLQQR